MNPDDECEDVILAELLPREDDAEGRQEPLCSTSSTGSADLPESNDAVGAALFAYLAEPHVEVESGLFAYLRAQDGREWVPEAFLDKDADDWEDECAQVLEYAEQQADERGWVYSRTMIRDLGIPSSRIADALAMAGWLPSVERRGGVKRSGWRAPGTPLLDDEG